MAALALFGLTILIVGGAFAVPASAHRAGVIADNDAPVLSASVLAFGLGGMNFAFAISFFFLGDVNGGTPVFALAPMAAGTLGLRVVRRKLTGGSRALHLVGAAAITLAGVPGYFALLVASLASVVVAALFLGGLVTNPRKLWRVLDPRL
jgi:hypothetical protein